MRSAFWRFWYLHIRKQKGHPDDWPEKVFDRVYG